MATPKYNTYVGMRYVPIFDGEWDRTKTYEPLVIVSNQGNSYTSRTFVPTGVDITNETYWALTGNYNAQVEYYRQETANVAEEVEQCVHTYNTVADMISDVNLEVDNTCRTLGYHSYNDGGCALYKIVEDEPVGLHEELSNNLYAILITDGEINIKQIGAYGDGTHDDTVVINTGINSNNKVFIPNGTYKVTDALVVNNGCNVELAKNAIIYLDSASVIDCLLQITNQYQKHDYDSKISGGAINCNYKANVAVGVHGFRHFKMEHMKIENFNTSGIDSAYNKATEGADCGEGVFDSLLIRNSQYKANSIGILDGHDNMYNNIVVQDTCVGFECGSSMFTNCHYWTSKEEIFDASIGFNIRTESIIVNANIDTCKTGFLFGANSNALLNNIEFIHNNAVISQAHANVVGIYLFDLVEGARVSVNNLNCLLYQGYTNVHKFTDRVLGYNENNYTISFANDFYLARAQLKNNITRGVSSPTRDLYAIKANDAGTDFTFTVPKFRKTDYAHFLLYGGQSWKWNFFIMGIVNDQNVVAFFPIYNPDNITFTSTYSGSTLSITASTTLYGGCRLIWLN